MCGASVAAEGGGASWREFRSAGRGGRVSPRAPPRLPATGARAPAGAQRACAARTRRSANRFGRAARGAAAWRRRAAAPRAAPAPAPRQSPRSRGSSGRESSGTPWRGTPRHSGPPRPRTGCARAVPAGPPRRAGGGIPGRGGPGRDRAGRRRVWRLSSLGGSMAHLFETRVSQSPVPRRGSPEVAVFVERMAVEIEGEGEPVLMIHGLGGTSNTFTPVLAAFARHRTVPFDLPGSGRSHRVDGPLSLTLFVDKTRLVMQRTGIEQAHGVAHSMGTIIAAHLAA